MCIAPPSLLSTGVMSALSRHSPAKRKNPDNQEWRTAGASRRPQIVGNSCDHVFIGFQHHSLGSHKRPRYDYAGKYPGLNCCPMQARSMPKTGVDQIGECFCCAQPIVQLTSKIATAYIMARSIVRLWPNRRMKSGFSASFWGSHKRPRGDNVGKTQEVKRKRKTNDRRSCEECV